MNIPGGIVRVITATLGLCAIFSCGPVFARSDGPGKTPVDFYEILKYAVMSQVVYKPDAQIRDYYDQYDLVIGQLSGQSIKYMVLTDRKNKEQTVAVQGTKCFKNILLDLEFSEKKDLQLGIRLHHGFDKAAAELHAELSAKGLLNKDYTTYLTGHSLGGAVALITAMYLKKDGFEIGRIVTFGQPKVTDREGAAKCADLPLLRVVNHHDEIPLLPSGRDSRSYVHFGPAVLLLKEYYFAYIRTPEADLADAPDFLGNFIEDNLEDHHLRHYFRNLAFKLSKNIEVPLSEKEKYLEEG
jgi:triacylglycerol lipase